MKNIEFRTATSAQGGLIVMGGVPGVSAGSRVSLKDHAGNLRNGLVIDGTGRIINNPSEVGGWLEVPPAEPCADSDHDGMADLWETRNGLDPQDPADALADADGDGYTNLEEFLNGTDPNP